MKLVNIFGVALLLASLSFNLIQAKRLSSARVINQAAERGLLSFTNLVLNGHTTSIVAYKDGLLSWSVSDDSMVMAVGFDERVTWFLNPTNHRVTKTVFELPGLNGKTTYLSDFNADGLTDQRHVLGENIEIFIDGQFIPVIATGRQRFIVKNGVTNEVIFNGHRWEFAK